MDRLVRRWGRRAARGELVAFSPRASARFCLQGDLLAWVHCSTYARYFSAEVLARTGLPPSELVAVIARGRLRRLRLGEALAEAGLLSADEVRECLFRHVVVHWRHAQLLPGPVAWCFVPTRHRYDPCFLFSLAELARGVPDPIAARRPLPAEGQRPR